MCRLFGLYANKPVDVRFSFYETPVKSFVEQSVWNPEGWGIAWFNGEEWRIYKEPRALYSSGEAERLIEKVVRGKIIVSHVRLASAGRVRRENTHPWLYRGWVFAHNGTIHGRRRLLRLLHREYQDLEGDTDSEALFHLIIQETENMGDPIKGIRSTIKKIIDKGISFSSLNFIASDGRKLYALRYATTSLDYYTLYYLERPREKLELRKLSRETRQLILMKLLHGEKAVIVASEKISEEPYWKLIPNKHLLVIDRDLNTETIPTYPKG
ncbi:glutamine amidotransferase, class-II [Staphylothermus marinus F1]|uniref:Glutamine amidotransferase, class-II n=1 Tax=Staphylothermus marinus (strain ATCC 43588 / DSM 3639 / JCM 9404 / F1) TaxID=399550 RepID=A3DMC1_STAMF|nr:class II glutamine amidotransferase [Staphylothermus marinus]ABN69781.1 glutamine amidotransferase, class-II [Staphylothermus marinus F1]